ncbi:MAG: HIRAN domain-containing protein [Betaproteobacteria bacterium]|nr:HIRAN domain-containing protein [Betaproteobacteria bacterium]
MFALALCPVPGHAQQVRILVQSSPLAGFRYHEAKAAFAELRPGDRLDLVREPSNPHDPNAVRVEWRGRKLGYVPRRENAALAWAMDRGEPVAARVSRLREHPNPRERIRFEVFIE